MDKTLQDVLFNIESAKAFTKGWHENISRWRQLYDDRHYDTTPKPGEERFSDPTYTNTVDLAVGIMLSNPLIWKATAWKPSSTLVKMESQVEKFLAGVLETNTNRNEYDSIYEVLLHYVRDGGCVLYTVWDDEIAKGSKSTETKVTPMGDEETIKVYTECPIVQQVIDPKTVHFLPGGRGRWVAVVRAEETTLFDIYSRFKTLPPSWSHLEKSPRSLLDIKGNMYDYWDVLTTDKNGNPVVRNATLWENEFIPGRELDVMKNYTSLPYTLGLYKPTSRTDTKKWASIITPLIEPVRHLERNINRRQRQIDLYSSLPVISKTVQGRNISMDAEMGQIVNITPDEDIAFPVWPGNAPDVERQIDFQRSRVQQSGFADVFYGSGTAQSSGYALSQLGDQNRIRLEQPIVHLKRFWEWSGKKIIETAVSHSEDDCYLRMFGKIRGEPFTDLIPLRELEGFHVTCDIKPNFPNDQVRKHAMGNQVRGVLSEETIMERYLDIQQPDDEFDRKVVEATQLHPLVMQYSIMKELNIKAQEGDEIAAQVLTQIQQQGMQGQPGAPEQPQNFEQPLGIGKPEAQEGSTEAAPNMAGGV